MPRPSRSARLARPVSVPVLHTRDARPNGGRSARVPRTRRTHRALVALAATGLLAFAGASFVGCAGAPGAGEDGGARIVRSANSPWKGLEAEAAVEAFLERSDPYQLSNAHLVGSLAAAYDGALVPALTERMATVDESAANADLKRLLLVRVGCDWAERNARAVRLAENGVAPVKNAKGEADAKAVAAAEAATARARETAALRLELLDRVDETIRRIDDPAYRRWMANTESDLACREAIERARSTANGTRGRPDTPGT